MATGSSSVCILNLSLLAKHCGILRYHNFSESAYLLCIWNFMGNSQCLMKIFFNKLLLTFKFLIDFSAIIFLSAPFLTHIKTF